MNVKSVILLLVGLVSFPSISQQLNQMILENWTNGSWENRMRQLPTYDEDGRLVKKEIAHWNADLKVWEDQTKTEFIRDENGYLMSRETFEWKPDQEIWFATIRSSYSINEKNKPSSVLTELQNEQGWYNSSIDEHKYDENGKLIQKISERWDKQLNSWIPNRKFDYTIESNRTAGYTIYFWDNHAREWQTYKKADYFYSQNGKIDHISFETWVDQSWKKHSVRRNIRDNEGVLNTMEVENFNISSEIWVKANQVEYEMTDFEKISESISKKWNTESKAWDNLQRSSYSYSKDGEMIEEWTQENQKMELFPNPATESLTIRSVPVGTITIIDALGKVVHQVEKNEEELIQLDISKWEIGVYSIQVNGNEIQKFVKQ